MDTQFTLVDLVLCRGLRFVIFMRAKLVIILPVLLQYRCPNVDPPSPGLISYSLPSSLSCHKTPHEDVFLRASRGSDQLLDPLVFEPLGHQRPLDKLRQQKSQFGIILLGLNPGQQWR